MTFRVTAFNVPIRGDIELELQHSVMLNARPPNEVSLYFADISSPVCFIAAMQLSSGMK